MLEALILNMTDHTKAMKPYLLLFSKAFFLFLSTSLIAQIPSYDQWYKGEIKVKDSSTFRGDLKFDFRDNIVYYKNEGTNLIFHASFIDNFEIFRSDGVHKKFVAKTFSHKLFKRKKFMIFQVIYPGSQSEVLAREYYILNSSYTNIPTSQVVSKKLIEENIYYRDRTKIKTYYKYYIQDKDGALKEIKLSRTNVIRAFNDEKEKIKEFIVRNELYFKRVTDLIKVVEYYDELN